MKITSNISQASIKIYINDVLHIHYKRDKFVSLQSWQYESEQMFYIEVILDGDVMTCDYDNRTLWTGILAELNKAC